jgi:uncharacterized damage-inducible protein DinB
MTIPKDHIQRRLKYHHWAADKIWEALEAVTAEQLDRKWGGSFGTGRALLRHVAGVERLWCDRWNGQSPKSLPDYPATHGGREFRQEWERIKPDQKRFVDALSQQRLDGDITYVNIKGETWTYALADVLEHLVNHGTYHRGQLTQLLRDLGLPAPSTDFLFFIDGKKG